eukprot:g79801.t1
MIYAINTRGGGYEILVVMGLCRKGKAMLLHVRLPPLPSFPLCHRLLSILLPLLGLGRTRWIRHCLRVRRPPQQSFMEAPLPVTERTTGETEERTIDEEAGIAGDRRKSFAQRKLQHNDAENKSGRDFKQGDKELKLRERRERQFRRGKESEETGEETWQRCVAAMEGLQSLTDHSAIEIPGSGRGQIEAAERHERGKLCKENSKAKKGQEGRTNDGEEEEKENEGQDVVVEELLKEEVMLTLGTPEKQISQSGRKGLHAEIEKAKKKLHKRKEKRKRAKKCRKAKEDSRIRSNRIKESDQTEQDQSNLRRTEENGQQEQDNEQPELNGLAFSPSSSPSRRNKRRAARKLQKHPKLKGLVRICTFNAENLMARFRFRDPRAQAQVCAATEVAGFTRNELSFDFRSDATLNIKAQALLEVDADIVCLQEVENLVVLDHFNQKFLSHLQYQYTMLIQSHDSRCINIGILSRYPFISVRSNKDEKTGENKEKYIFSRDCIELDIAIGRVRLCLYVTHLTAMNRGRDETAERRQMQSEFIWTRIQQRWRSRDYLGNFVVLGDLNEMNSDDAAITSLTRNRWLVNVVERMPDSERWTHYFAKGDSYNQLDYILLSRALSLVNRKAPSILRKGLPLRAERYLGRRYSGVGHDNPKASDHCPVPSLALTDSAPVSHFSRRRLFLANQESLRQHSPMICTIRCKISYTHERQLKTRYKPPKSEEDLQKQLWNTVPFGYQNAFKLSRNCPQQFIRELGVARRLSCSIHCHNAGPRVPKPTYISLHLPSCRILLRYVSKNARILLFTKNHQHMAGRFTYIMVEW